MKKIRLLLLSLFCLAGAAALMFTTLNRSATTSETGETRRVALLAANETGTFYMQLKQGAQDAAENLNASLVVEIIGADRLAEQIAGLAEDGVVAAIVYCADENLTADALIALNDADIFSVTLHNEAGDWAILGDADTNAAMLAGAAEEAGCGRALVVGENAALAEAFEKAWDGEILYADDIDSVAILPGDCVIALTASATRIAMARTADIPLFGVDSGDTGAADLETGTVDGALLPRPYAIGYRAAEAALSGGKGITYVSAKLVTPETMYLPENVGIVFPLIQ